jgi:hypothetical protein
MGLTHPDIVSFIADEGLESCLERVRSDNAFVRQYALESLRESLTLDYASYILALAMGAGKTILMGSIVATEFAMAMEYPDGPFVQNALIFAPGKTISARCASCPTCPTTSCCRRACTSCSPPA